MHPVLSGQLHGDGDTCKANHKGDPGDLLGYAGLPEVPGGRIAHPEWDILSLYFYVGRRDGAGSPKGLEALEIRLSSASPSVRVHVSLSIVSLSLPLYRLFLVVKCTWDLADGQTDLALRMGPP